MRKQMAVTAALASALLITGCANTGMSDTTRRTATGAGVGALGGAAIGAIAGGHAGKGALIGAGVGGLGTYIWSQNLEKQKREMEAATQGTGGVTRPRTTSSSWTSPATSRLTPAAPTSRATSPPSSIALPKVCATTPTQKCASSATPTAQAPMPSTTLCRCSAPKHPQLSDSRGVNGARIQVQGMGSHQPVASNTNEGRARNRRVEIFVGERAPQ
jgi:hypothetical protein